jgi:hypothetical protein
MKKILLIGLLLAVLSISMLTAQISVDIGGGISMAMLDEDDFDDAWGGQVNLKLWSIP